MSHAKPFASSAARDTAAIDTEEMQTDELIGPDGSPLVDNSEELFDAPTHPPAEPRTVAPEAKEEDTPNDEVPVPDEVVDDGDIIGELPPPSDRDIDLAVGDIVARAARTDDYLRQWRSTSVDRKEEWEVDHARQLELEAKKRGWFYLGAAGGVVAVLLGFCGLLMSGVLDAPIAAPLSAEAAPAVAAEKAPAAARVTAPAVVAQEAPDEASHAGTDAAPEAPTAKPAVAAEPAEVSKAVEAPELPEPAAEPTRARVVVTGRSDAGPTVLADGETWTEGRFRWVGALVAEEGVELAWFDGAGREVLDRVACAGRDGEGFRCLSGRSPKRIGWALEQGAEAGVWTVKACRGDACTPLGTTEVAETVP